MTTTNSTSVVFTTDAHNDRYRESSLRLASRSAAIRERLVAELSHTQARHEIDWRSLLSSQRDIAEQIAKGSSPDTTTYWEQVAKPRGNDLLAACLQVVDAHLLLVWDAVAVFVEGVLPTLSINDQPVSLDALQSLRCDVEHLIEPIAHVALDRSGLDEIGDRWHERLRRQAIRRYVRSGGIEDAGFADAIDKQELKMLHQAPWAQADQLLSAYELAHADLRRGLSDRIDRMLTDLICA